MGAISKLTRKGFGGSGAHLHDDVGDKEVAASPANDIRDGQADADRVGAQKEALRARQLRDVNIYNALVGGQSYLVRRSR